MHTLEIHKMADGRRPSEESRGIRFRQGALFRANSEPLQNAPSAHKQLLYNLL